MDIKKCSSNLTVFVFRFSFKDKYQSIFSSQMEVIVYVSFHFFIVFSYFFHSDVDSVEKRKVYVSQNVLRIWVLKFMYNLPESLIPNNENTITIEPKQSAGSMSYPGLILAKKKTTFQIRLMPLTEI